MSNKEQKNNIKENSTRKENILRKKEGMKGEGKGDEDGQD
jgi:hypothetical protein